MTYNVFGGTLNPTLLLPSSSCVCFNVHCNPASLAAKSTKGNIINKSIKLFVIYGGNSDGFVEGVIGRRVV